MYLLVRKVYPTTVLYTKLTFEVSSETFIINL